MFAALTAHCGPGDEVICIEPYFDQYFASIQFQGAKAVFVPLHPPTGEGIKNGGDWTLNMDEFAAAFTPKTKAVIINTPHNPVGKVFTKQELEQIAKICIEKNVLVLADEVYDCMVYDGKEHCRIATLPGMWERTLTVGSGGKSFACTGWRVGESTHFIFSFLFVSRLDADSAQDGLSVPPNSPLLPSRRTAESSSAPILPCKKPSLSASKRLPSTSSLRSKSLLIRSAEMFFARTLTKLV